MIRFIRIEMPIFSRARETHEGVSLYILKDPTGKLDIGLIRNTVPGEPDYGPNVVVALVHTLERKDVALLIDALQRFNASESDAPSH